MYITLWLPILTAFAWIFPFQYFQPGHVTVRVTQGKNSCHTVVFSHCFHQADGACIQQVDQGLHEYHRGSSRDKQWKTLQVRRNSSGDFLFGLDYIGGTMTQSVKIDSPDHFLLRKSLDKTQAVSQDDWNAATPAGVWARYAESDVVRGENPETTFRYQGRLFATSGPFLTDDDSFDSSLSLTGKYIAVQSAQPHDLSNCGFPCGRFYGGRYWIDLYDTASGQRVIAMTGDLFNTQEIWLFNNVEWIGDRYVLSPIEDTMRKLLICDVSTAHVSHK